MKHYVDFRVGCRGLIRVCVSSWNFVVVVIVIVPDDGLEKAETCSVADFT